MRQDRTCDGCGRRLDAARVTITTEATDDRGVNVDVAKRWELCRPCADAVFARIGEPSPWSDEDFKTMILPDEEALAVQPGGYASLIR